MKDSRLLKMFVLTVLCVILVFLLKPVLIISVIYKISLVMFGACVFFWLDRLSFPYARPDGYLSGEWEIQEKLGPIEGHADFRVVSGYELIFAMSFVRRALMMCIGGSLGVAMGL